MDIVPALLKTEPIVLVLVLCILLALLVYKLLGGRRGGQFDSGPQSSPEILSNPVMTAAWFKRAESHFQQGHRHSNLLQELQFRVEHIEKELKSVTDDLRKHKEQGDSLTERFVKTETTVEIMAEGQERLIRMVEGVQGTVANLLQELREDKARE